MTSKAKRRSYTAEYKRKVLQEADACTEAGQMGALLRREGLYSSHLTTWRQARERGELAGLEPKKRGPKLATATRAIVGRTVHLFTGRALQGVPRACKSGVP